MATTAATKPARRNRVIHDVVRRHIVERRLPDGLVLTESALARLFEVSRAPAADALGRLADEGLVTKLDGRGFAVGAGRAPPLRADLASSGLRVPVADRAGLAARGWRETLYPVVEAEVASCSSYGVFGTGSAVMGRHFGVSRTTSQDVLSRLERVGLIEQGANGRWIVPRLTPKGATDHYEIRRLLEPAALADAARRVGPEAIRDARARIVELRAKAGPWSVDEIRAVEANLHHELVLECDNERMRATILRSQLPLIATHMAFERNRQLEEMARLLEDHDAVLAALEAGRRREAGRLLRRHLDHGLRSTIEYLERKPDPPAGLVPTYLTRLD